MVGASRSQYKPLKVLFILFAWVDSCGRGRRRCRPPCLSRTNTLSLLPPGNNLTGVNDFRTENGSSQGQNLALTGLCVPSSFDGIGGGGGEGAITLFLRARILFLLFRGGLVFRAHRLLYHSTPGLSVITEKKRDGEGAIILLFRARILSLLPSRF